MEIKRLLIAAFGKRAFALAEGYAQLATGNILTPYALSSALRHAADGDAQYAAQTLAYALPNAQVERVDVQTIVRAHAPLLKGTLTIISATQSRLALVELQALQSAQLLTRLLQLARLKQADVQMFHDLIEPSFVARAVEHISLLRLRAQRAAFDFYCDGVAYYVAVAPHGTERTALATFYVESAFQDAVALCGALESGALDFARFESELRTLEAQQ